MSDERVTLRGGLTVHVRPLALLWALEDAGAALVEHTPGMLRVVADAKVAIPPEVRADLPRWKIQLLALVRYNADSSNI